MPSPAFELRSRVRCYCRGRICHALDGLRCYPCAQELQWSSHSKATIEICFRHPTGPRNYPGPDEQCRESIEFSLAAWSCDLAHLALRGLTQVCGTVSYTNSIHRQIIFSQQGYTLKESKVGLLTLCQSCGTGAWQHSACQAQRASCSHKVLSVSCCLRYYQRCSSMLSPCPLFAHSLHILPSKMPVSNLAGACRGWSHQIQPGNMSQAAPITTGHGREALGNWMARGLGATGLCDSR